MNTTYLWKCRLLAFAVMTTGLLNAATGEMTNADVVKMVQATVSPDLIILSIQNNEAHFAMDSDSIIVLTQAGVSPEIIKAMSAKQTPSTAPTSPASDRLSLGKQDKIPVFIKNTNGSGEFTDPNQRHAKSIQDSTRDFLKALKESSPIRIVGSERDALVVVEILDRETKSTGNLLWGMQNKSSLTLRLTAGSYSTEIRAESGMRGQTTGYSAAAAKAAKLVEDWVTVNHNRLTALRGQ